MKIGNLEFEDFDDRTKRAVRDFRRLGSSTMTQDSATDSFVA
ncbi:MAG: hypothetical protein ACXABY_17845 [Candidatus Thorarchaeota archaeon]|jgi:hypothetical protein